MMGGSSAFTVHDHCTYVIQSQCGAPGFDVTYTNAADTNVKLAYLEWDTASPNFVASPTFSMFPISTSTV